MAKFEGFDKICKRLLKDLGEQYGFIPKSSYPINSQTALESSAKLLKKEKSISTVDVAWLKPLSSIQALGSLESRIFSDVVVAWEVDCCATPKALRSSVINLETLNARLGIELLILGNTKDALRRYDSMYENAVESAKKSKARIIVINDLILSWIYFKSIGHHPEILYNAYLQAAGQKELRALIREKWEELLKEIKTEKAFRKGLNEKLLHRLSE